MSQAKLPRVDDSHGHEVRDQVSFRTRVYLGYAHMLHPAPGMGKRFNLWATIELSLGLEEMVGVI